MSQDYEVNQSKASRARDVFVRGGKFGVSLLFVVLVVSVPVWPAIVFELVSFEEAVIFGICLLVASNWFNFSGD